MLQRPVPICLLEKYVAPPEGTRSLLFDLSIVGAGADGMWCREIDREGCKQCDPPPCGAGHERMRYSIGMVSIHEVE